MTSSQKLSTLRLGLFSAMRVLITSTESSGATALAASITRSSSVFASASASSFQSNPSSSMAFLNASNLSFLSRAFSRYWAIGMLKRLYPLNTLNSFQIALTKVELYSTLSPIVLPMLKSTVCTMAPLSQFARSRISAGCTFDLLSGLRSGSNSSTASQSLARAFSQNFGSRQKLRYFRKCDLPDP